MGPAPRMLQAAVLLTSIGLAVTPIATRAASYDNAYDQGFRIDDKPDGAVMFADALVVRPMTLVTTAIGAVGWVLSLPFSIPGGNMEEAGQKLVVDPAHYTFARPLGYMQDKEPVKWKNPPRGEQSTESPFLSSN